MAYPRESVHNVTFTYYLNAIITDGPNAYYYKYNANSKHCYLLTNLLALARCVVYILLLSKVAGYNNLIKQMTAY